MISIATQDILPYDDSPAVESEVDRETFIFRSRLPDIVIPDHLPLHAYCFEKMAEVADKPCLISGSTGRTYTFAETHLLCRRAAAGLAGLGVRQGDVIFLLLQNCPEFAFCFMAASFLGAATTAANPLCTPAEILKQLKSAGAKLVVTQSIYADKLGGGLTVITVDDPPLGCLPFSVLSAADEAAIPESSIDTDDAVALPFSSGTTGLPKGVVLTHRSLVSSVAQQVDGENPNLHLRTDDLVLCVLPLFHIFSLNSVLLCSLRAGAAVLIIPRFEIEAMLGLIEKHKVTVAAVVPPMVLSLVKNPVVDIYNLGSIRIIISGASALGEGLEAALQCRFPQAILGQGYGMTEAGPVLSMSPAFAKRPLAAKSGSCGTVVRNAELKVIDLETGLSLDRNKPGEICIRGPQIMKGYLNEPNATSAIIDLEGWLHTGDIGYVDDDDEVFIVERVKELIKYKGFQVAPAELEALLIGHPSIIDAAVISQKDEVAGEVPIAFVVRSDLELNEIVVREFIAKQVVYYKRLHKVYFVNAIPKSPAGKILRKDLRARLANCIA